MQTQCSAQSSRQAWKVVLRREGADPRQALMTVGYGADPLSAGVDALAFLGYPSADGWELDDASPLPMGNDARRRLGEFDG